MNRFTVRRRLATIGLAAAAAVTLSLVGPSGAMADTPVPIPASDPMPLPASDPGAIPAAPISTAGHLAPRVASKPKTRSAAVTPQTIGVFIGATPANEPITGEIPLLAQTDTDITQTPYYIMIVDDSNGQVVADCGVGTQCSTYVASAAAVTKNYTVYVADYATTVSGMQNIQAISQPQTVTWYHVCG